ncbi:DUF2381 family protein [Melittangium boletus]|uniref:DUF2381 family protein n=1 Tax=Melittangium boletus TaxID=83453 RepID=UPI003DA22E39
MVRRGWILFVLWALPSLAEMTPERRALRLTAEPARWVPGIYGAGGAVTTLRFEQPCDAERTRLLGWEGRFEPLSVWGRSVSLVPLQALSRDDRFLLLVTLQDGSELPFTVTGRSERWDAQVDVFVAPASAESLQVALVEERERNEQLLVENLRHREEGTSVDHALAALLARGEVSTTPFRPFDASLSREGGREFHATVLISKEKATRKKVAIVFKVKNTDSSASWTLMRAHLEALATEQERPLALRAFPEVLEPGRTGRIAVVTDLSAFDPKKDGDKLVFTLFRDEGYPVGHLVLDVSALPP